MTEYDDSLVSPYIPTSNDLKDCTVRHILVDLQNSTEEASSTFSGRNEPTYRLRNSLPTDCNCNAPFSVSWAYGV